MRYNFIETRLRSDINQWISSMFFKQSGEGGTRIERCLWVFSLSKSCHLSSLHPSHVKQDDDISPDTAYDKKHSQSLIRPLWSQQSYSIILLKLWEVYFCWVCDLLCVFSLEVRFFSPKFNTYAHLHMR